jgi:hypothetical protein
VSSVHIEPGKKVSVRIFTFGEHDQDPSAGKEYDLLLAKVAAFRLTSLHLPSRIQGHSLTISSSFLEEARRVATLDALGIDPLRLQHYQLITDSGQIDVASEIAGALPI